RRRDRGGQTGGLPRGGGVVDRWHRALSDVGLPRAALRAEPARRCLRGPLPARGNVCELRPFRVGADGEPGAGRVPHLHAAPAALAALVERGGDRDLDAAAPARHLAVQPLPAVRGRCDRPPRRLLLLVSDRDLRVGDPARARGAAMAGAAMSANRPGLPVVLANPRLIAIFSFWGALSDR